MMGAKRSGAESARSFSYVLRIVAAVLGVTARFPIRTLSTAAAAESSARALRTWRFARLNTARSPAVAKRFCGYKRSRIWMTAL